MLDPVWHAFCNDERRMEKMLKISNRVKQPKENTFSPPAPFRNSEGRGRKMAVYSLTLRFFHPPCPVGASPNSKKRAR